MTQPSAFEYYFTPTIKDARMLHFSAASLGAALGAFFCGRYLTHLTGGQALGYGLSGLSASSFFAQFGWIGILAGPPAVEILGEGTISSSLNLREIAMVVAAAYVGTVLTIHALNMATWAYNKYYLGT